MPRRFFLIQVVVGIVINEMGKILIAKRPKNKTCPGLWEFPGGKIESDEEIFAALQREFNEEIGIKIILADPWFTVQYTYPDRVVSLNNWLIKKFSGEPYGAEGQTIQWVFPSELTSFEFPAGNQTIIEKIMLLPAKG